MPLLDEGTRQQIVQELAGLEHPVKLVMFTQTFECDYCNDTRQLCEELAELSDKLSVQVFNFVADEDKAQAYNIDKIPAIAVVGEKDYGVRFFGVPSGYEFMSLLDSIKTVSAGKVAFMPETEAFLGDLERPLHIQVYVTPT
jgi:glutaredoxin-like protein